ncbi:E3 ubiquitin-protein ligase EL5-like [Brachypodium distachyon]|uniref:E3 ubiquitin-protein ligase EL5-like n=1 Tax=Brachypodium distachyon TaxID=15368 RepID=UPI0005300851|nr:E3 ubiquitin-protein ligase EL5-like [Brachypodium distachyon]|eukprot:XP_024314566.1 E3 ubiquitin-protein ligase EL5-like [Brachypodium distachyon]
MAAAARAASHVVPRDINVLVVFPHLLLPLAILLAQGWAAEPEFTDASYSPPAVSPRPKARNRQELERAITALPAFVHCSDNGHGAVVQAVECAICIAEFSDGEEGRLLPRCGAAAPAPVVPREKREEKIGNTYTLC